MAVRFNDGNFDQEVLKVGGLVLVDFFAEWCGPCKMLAPVMEELASEVPDVKIGKLDVDESSATSEKYGVSSIPTLILFKGGKEVGRLNGFQSKEVILKKLNELK